MEVPVRSGSLLEDPKARVHGIMFVSGYVMSIKDDGRAGIVSVRGGGGKFVRILLIHFYVNQKRVERPHTLHTFLQKGSYINLFMEDCGFERQMCTFRVRYESVMCWIGSHGHVPDVGPYRKFWQRWALECSKSSSIKSHDIHVDVPVSSLTEQSGTIYWCSETYGLVAIRKGKSISNALFTADRFYLAQRKFLTTENLAYPTADALVVAITKPIPRRRIFGVTVDMEAVVVFCGEKPIFNLIYVDHNVVKPNYEYQKLANSDPGKTESDCLESGTKSWADEANDAFIEQRIFPKPVQAEEVKENPSSYSQTASYLTGHFLGNFGDYFAFGSEGKACRFTIECFHVSEMKFSTVKSGLKYLSCERKAPLLHGYVIPLKRPVNVGRNVRFLWEAVCVWHGPAPAALKVKINSLKKVPLRLHAGATNCSQATDILVDRRELMATLPQVPFDDSVKRGRLTGFVLSCSASDAIVTGFSSTVYLTRERFYVNGQKYRGTSLLSFFQKKKEKVNTYIVPMEMRVVRGCAVYSRAVCAWVGDEPADLQKRILTNKIYTNFEISDTHEKSKGQFYYMVGHVQKMGETCGVIECKIDGTTASVGFSVQELYKYGKKVSTRSILSMHSQVLLTSRWSVLAYCAPHKAVPGSNFTAVAVWHHGDQMLLFDEFQNKLPLWHRQLLAGRCSCADNVAKLADKMYNSVSKGAITERRKDEVAVGIKDQGIVWVKRDHVVVDGCTCCLSKVDEHRMCYVVFDAHKFPLYAWMGRQPGGSRTCSDVHISHVDCTSDDSDAETDCDGSSSADGDSEWSDEEENGTQDFNDDLMSMELSDPADLFSLAKRPQNIQKGVRTNRRKDEMVSHCELDTFSGIHGTGHIVNMEADYAILSWHSAKIKGTIFIYLDLNHLYINGEPFKKSCYTQFGGKKVLMTHICHFYLNTVPEILSYGLLEICAIASAGWIGNKPIFMPPPGKQGKGIFDIHALRMAYSKPPHPYIEFCSYASWLDHLEKDALKDPCGCKHHFSPSFMHAETAATPSDDEQKFVLASLYPKNGHASHSPLPDFPTKAAVARDVLSSTVEEQNHLNGLSVPVTSSHVTAHYESPSITNAISGNSLRSFSADDNLDVAQIENQDIVCTTPVLTSVSTTGLDDLTSSIATVALGDSDTDPASSASDECNSLQGQITELHPFLGKLHGRDGNTHYFKSEHFFLFGIPLKNVELYNVLIQGLEVQYQVGASGELEACWYGSRLRDVTSYSRLRQWCADNFVSDEVLDLLEVR